MIRRGRRRALLLAALSTATVGCRSSTDVPEAGALLLRVSLAARAPAPDELRLWLFDDTGALWSNARFPTEGALVPQSGSTLGTILIQPGTTVGNLRLDVRGLRAGAIAEEALATISAAARAAGLFDVSLSSTLPSDGDGDGVPDPIDDCPVVADTAQTGCAPGAGGSEGSGGTGGPGGASGAGGAGGAGGKDSADVGGGSGDQATGGAGGGSGVAGHAGGGGGTGIGGRGGDGGGTSLPQGAACAAAAQCRSGFCKDGACCDTACTDACNSCTTGKCTPVTSGEDAPECAAPMFCNKKSKCAGN